MGKSETIFEQLELKYCERCGGLWLRRKGSAGVFCAGCAPAMAEFPSPRRERPGDSRLPIGPAELNIKASTIEIWAVTEVEP